jgi:hypothetical protein
MISSTERDEVHMPGQVAPVADERDGLLSYLGQQRLVIKLTAHGLTDDQARATPLGFTTLSVGGLVKHVAFVERNWIDTVRQRERGSTEEYERGFSMAADQSLADVVALYDEVARETESVIAGIADLGQPVPVPQGVPWFPDDVDAWSVRWVLLHLIQETARHAGHADIIREAIDGATAFPLMAAAEGWPQTPWMKPWSPEGAGAA